MKAFAWNSGKNENLRQDRNISFEMIVSQIGQGKLLEVVEHPNREKYPNQRIFVVNIDDYAYLVPFVESETEISLKTIIPSRKATRDYLRGKTDDN